jgi:hypothetical protein
VRAFEFAAWRSRVVFGLRAARERLVEATEEVDAQRVLVLAAPAEADLARGAVRAAGREGRRHPHRRATARAGGLCGGRS